MNEPRIPCKGSAPELEVDKTCSSLVSRLDHACKVTNWRKNPDYKRILLVLIELGVPRDILVLKEKAIKEQLSEETLKDVDDIDFGDYLALMSPSKDDLSTPNTLDFMRKPASDIQSVSGLTNGDTLGHGFLRRRRPARPVTVNKEFQKDVSRSASISNRPSSVRSSTRQSSPAPSVEPNIQGKGLHTRIYSWKSRCYYPAIYLEDGMMPYSSMRFTVAERAHIDLREDRSCTLERCQGHAWLYWQPIDCVGMIDTEFHIFDHLPAELVMGQHALQEAESLRISSASQDAHANLRRSSKPPLRDLQGFSTGVNAPLTPNRTPSPPSARQRDETSRGRNPSHRSGSVTPTRQVTEPISVPNKETGSNLRQLHQRLEDIGERPSSVAAHGKGKLDAFKEPGPKGAVPTLEGCSCRLSDALFQKIVLVLLAVLVLLTSYICYSTSFGR